MLHLPLRELLASLLILLLLRQRQRLEVRLHLLHIGREFGRDLLARHRFIRRLDS